ncbi:hypothetical protein HF908_05010 [Ralstonia pseudosolanacearum]|uniref:hypothetical protein n=1 Tax=Ralstonia pseudosolanacearum TaxID=1310165 RepID=UPI001865E3C3|nr:hypothetical protein [Ralstonia pseudosolanacearum]QOK90896.1 hypothetical protein HF908_05010 [Ralstonia pseudosolanacearum]
MATVSVELKDHRAYEFVQVARIEDSETAFTLIGDEGNVIAFFDKAEVKSLTTNG